MRYHEIISLDEGSTGTFTAAQAREIGSCAIIAMSKITGLSWEEVFEVAKPHFGRYGMNAGQSHATLRELGWKDAGIIGKIMMKNMNVRQAEAYLRENEPDARVMASINVDRIPHAIAFVDGQFHNVLGAYRAKVQLAYRWVKT